MTAHALPTPLYPDAVTDAASSVPCTRGPDGFHAVDARGEAMCPVCYPRIYATEHARHRGPDALAKRLMAGGAW